MFSVFGIIKMIKISQWIKVRNGTALCGAFSLLKMWRKFLKAKNKNPPKRQNIHKKTKNIAKKLLVLYDGRTKQKGGFYMKFQRLKDMVCGAVIASMVLCSGTVAFA